MQVCGRGYGGGGVQRGQGGHGRAGEGLRRGRTWFCRCWGKRGWWVLDMDGTLTSVDSIWLKCIFWSFGCFLKLMMRLMTWHTMSFTSFKIFFKGIILRSWTMLSVLKPLLNIHANPVPTPVNCQKELLLKNLSVQCSSWVFEMPCVLNALLLWR